ncbi:cytochrome P450 [Mycolicibacterium monacense]|uniref:Cytochrome P450 n=2 Tax=Mycolicibacterium monacense TaxID=85693 RepID=A0AAD1N2E3_MYCMB|nr:cytochrome P450 [Mycolicibacterium monacense]MDA4105357.1 cytochrome P450 [Mycolicibacterium monacense DSM 44395]QHP88567.1 cytochrome P450 [Mycolicibacterium monacense DSM 44395]BBZ64011.1 cytochrome P450 [Mycolicibacterium monacense]
MTALTAQLTSPANTHRLQVAGAALTSRFPSREEPLATPPPGSNLKPVMGNYGFPFLGHTLSALAEPLDFARRRYDMYGPVSWAGGVGFRVVALMGPDALETAWINRDKVFSSTRGWAPVIGPFFHRGIMLLDFEEHRDHRRIMQQAFARTALDGYLELMRPGIDRTLGGWPASDAFPFYPSIKHLLLEQAAEVFVGTHLGPESDQLSADFHDTVRGGQALLRADVPGGVWARGLRARKRLERYFGDQIADRQRGDGADLFSMLCRSEDDDGARFTPADIVNHMIFLLMAAHDTTAIALSMLVYELGRKRKWQKTLRDEAVGRPNDAPTVGDLDAYPLLDAAFKEILRMYAPAGTLFRQTTRDTDILGHFVPAKTQVAINVHASMRLADWWPDPDTFDPARFIDQPGARAAVSRYAFAPFGGGAHKCIGQQFADMTVKTTMHQMLRRFEWSVADGYRIPLTWGTGPTPADDLPITLRTLTT